jgi:large repetitive protein
VTVAAPELAHELVQLGIAVGILRPVPGGGPDDYTLNRDWFEDPGRYLGGVLRDPEQREAALALAQAALGSAGEELDLHELPADETWLPLASSHDPEAGLFAVVKTESTATGEDVLITFGGRVATAETLGGAGIESACTVSVPLLRAQGGAAGGAPPPTGVADFLVGTPEGVVRVAASVSLDGGLGAGVDLRGVAADVAIPTDGTAPSVSLVLHGLLLPGDEVPRDVALSELDELGREAARIAVGLLIARLEEAGPELRHLLALLGVAPPAGIPELPVAELLGEGTTVLSGWARAVAGDPAAVRVWVEELAALLGAAPFAGLGTLAEPYLVCVGADPLLCVTLGVEPDAATGVPVMRPGFRISAEAPAAAPVPARLVGAIELAAVSLGQTVDGVALPSLDVYVELGSTAAGADALVETTLPAPANVTVAIQRARLGLTLDGRRRVAPVVEARDVTIGGTRYDVIDLSSADAVAEAAAGALDAVVQSLLDALGATPRGHALAALAGLVRPAGVAEGDPWPALPAIADLFADPVAALLCYHVALLEPAGGSIPWARMAGELATLLRADAPDEGSTGSGSGDDPWSARVFDNTASGDDVRGTVDILAWTQASPAPGGPELTLAARLRTAGSTIGGKALTLSLTSEVVRLSLPAATACPGPVTPAWAPSHILGGRLDADLELDAGPVVALAHAVQAAVRWRREDGVQTAVTIEQPGIRANGTQAVMPDLTLPFGGPLELASPATLPWPELELLLGQLLESLGGIGARVAALVGWSPSVGDVSLELSGLPDLALELPAGTLPHLPLDLLISDPAAALRAWLASLTQESGDWPDVTLPAAAWLSSLLSGVEPEGGRLAARVGGIGTYEEPWAVSIGAAEAAPELLVWLDPAGSALAGLPGLVEHLVPTDSGENGGDEAPSAVRPFELLRRAAMLSPALREALGDRDDLAAAVEALRDRVADGDGLVGAANQRVPAEAPDAGRWSAGDLAETSHLGEPARFGPDTHLGAGPPSPERRIFVSSPLPLTAPWPGQEAAPADHVIDLRAPGLAPEAFDLSAIARAGGAGSWYVLLPPRAAAGGLPGLVGRLRRAVAAVREAVGAGPLAVVAHGTSGHVARLLAADGGLTHLVTVGTPHGGATFEFLDQAQTSDAIRLLQRLRALAAEDAAPALAGLLDTLGVALDGYVARPDGTLAHVPLPVDDFAPPAFPALHADTTFARALVGRISTESFDAAVAALVLSVLRTAADALPGWTAAPDARQPPTHVGFGLRAPLVVDEGAPGALTVAASARLDLARVAVGEGEERQLPQVVLRAELRRTGGWLAGGPDPAHAAGTPRDPRVRWAALVLRVGLDPPDSSVAVELYDASVFGASRPVWLVDQDELAPEARVLLGEAVNGLGPLPPTGPLRGLADTLAALGALEIGADGTAAVVTDSIERLLVDPLDELQRITRSGAAGRDAFLAALRSWVGSATSGEDDAVVVPLGAAFEQVIRLGPPAAIELRTTAGGLTVEGAGRLDGSVRLDEAGRLAVQARTSALAESDPAPVPALVVSVDTTAVETVRITLEDGEALELYPTPSGELPGRGTSILVGELLRVAADWAAGQSPAVVPPLLDALGLRRGERVRNPAAFIRDPGAWLAHPSVLGRANGGAPALNQTAVRRLLAAAHGLVAPGAPADRIPLPWGLELAVEDAGADPVLALVWTPPVAGGDAPRRGALRLRVGPGFEVTPSLAAGVDLEGLAGFDEIGVDLAFDGLLTARLRLHPAGGAEVVVPLLPSSPGLGTLADLANAAVDQLLPLALDALARADDPVGTTVGTLGDALGLRTGAPARFRADELRRLGADPAGELQARLRVQAATALDALRSLLAPLLPAGGTVADGTRPGTGVPFLEVVPVAGVTIELEVPAAGPPRLCVGADGIEPLAGLAVGGRACVTSSGLEAVRVDAEVTSDALLRLGSVPILPFARVLLSGTEPPGPDHRLELGIWTAPAARPDDRRGIVAKLPFAGAASVACRSADGTTDSSDLTVCAAFAVRVLLVPLAAELVLSAAPVVARLEKPVGGGATTIGQILDDADILARTAAPAGATYDLAPGAPDPEKLGGRVLALGGRVVDALGDGFGAGDALDPVTVALARADHGGRSVYGVRIGLAEPLELFSDGGVRLRLEADASWTGEEPPPPAGVELLFVSLPTGTLDPGEAQLQPWIRVNGVGLRALGAEGGKLIDLVASVESVALHGVYRRNLAEPADAGIELAGGRLLLDRFGVPLGRASGGNPVAAKLLSQGQEAEQAGDRKELAPAFSPQLILLRRPPASTALTFRAGEGVGPWWLPMQQRFGPLYVEQVGLDTVEVAGHLDRVKALLDGGVSLAGLTVGLDDLSVSLPWRRPWDLADWRLDLAGLAIGYDSGGISVAGGLRRRPGPAPDYVGLVLVKAAQLGVTAVAGYAEIPEAPGSSRTYTSFFIFAAVSFTLGGPPAFFVTGLGGGAGLNRRLVLPAEVVDVPRFPLVAAMDPTSPFATNPMGALDTLGPTFPPERGTFWFAAGVRFTSFVLVESIAVLSVEVGDGGTEVALLGLSRMDLPNREFALARVELALRARFSSREGVLKVEGQLTDNSYLLNPQCRLTGGFAFVMFFKGSLAGQFVLTLGGYHPRFARPAAFPPVPRLGFDWHVSSNVTVKGEAYFALTATCVMAGGRLEAAYKTSTVWASFTAGVDAIVSWDPFFYDVTVYVRVSAGVDIRVCFFHCFRVRFSCSIGAELHVFGPEIRGTAKLDLDVTSVTVRFGPSGETNSREPLGWTEFRSKYLVAGDPEGLTMSAGIAAGQLVPDPAAGRDQQETGQLERSWRVVPEFVLVTATRAASNDVNGRSLGPVTPQALDLGPMHLTGIVSAHRVRIRNRRTGAEETLRLELEPVVGNVPEGVWRKLAETDAAPEANVRPAFVGATLVARATVPPVEVRAALDQVEVSKRPHPLPFADEQDDREEFTGDVEHAEEYVAAQPTDAHSVLALAREKLTSGFAASRASPLERAVFFAERAAPPRLAPLTEGMVDAVKPPVELTLDKKPPKPPRPDTRIAPPRLRALLRSTPPAEVRGPVRTTVAPAAGTLARVPAPTLVEARAVATARAPARLVLTGPLPTVERATVLPADAGPPTARAGGLTEVRVGLFAHAEAAAALGDMERTLADGEAVPLTAGDLLVWELPNAENDTGDSRPLVSAAGDQRVRIVVADRGGEVLADETGEELEVTVPRGAYRIAAAGLGVPASAAADPGGLAGWHAGTRLRQIADDVYLGPATVVRSTSPFTLRGRRPVGTAVVPAAVAVGGRGVVATRLAPTTQSIAVVVQATDDIDHTLTGLALGLDGAQRRGGTAGPEPPLIVVSGSRAHGVFAIEPEQAANAVVVTVASDERWQLAGIVGSAGDPAELAAELAERGLDGVLADETLSPLGLSQLRWRQPEEVG